MELKNKVALVTGAAKNIGKSIARSLASEGAKVIVCDIDEKSAIRTAEEVRELGVEADVLICDVRDRETVYAEVKRLEEKLGRIDILVNNAGGSAALLNKISKFVDAEDSTLDFVIDVNVRGMMNFTKAVLPGMLERRCGRIINMSSIAAVVGLATRVDYSAAKGAVIGFTQALAIEVGYADVTVNCVSPGAIGRNGAQMKHMTFLGEDGRSGEPEHIAEAVTFLAKHDFITGQNIVVDGGRVLGPNGR